jgi:hypothetical protein
MQWKAELQGDDSVLTQLAQGNSPGATILRDGVGWFLESSEFAYFSDHVQVKERAAAIVKEMLAARQAPPEIVVGVGAIYRIHYDNSKSVFR